MHRRGTRPSMPGDVEPTIEVIDGSGTSSLGRRLQKGKTPERFAPGVFLVDLVALGPRDRVTPASATRLRGHPLRDRHLHQAASTTHWITSYQACRVRRVPTRPAPVEPPRLPGPPRRSPTGTRGPWSNITADSKPVRSFFSSEFEFFSASGPESRVLQGPVGRPERIHQSPDSSTGESRISCPSMSFATTTVVCTSAGLNPIISTRMV